MIFFDNATNFFYEVINGKLGIHHTEKMSINFDGIYPWHMVDIVVVGKILDSIFYSAAISIVLQGLSRRKPILSGTEASYFLFFFKAPAHVSLLSAQSTTPIGGLSPSFFISGV